MEFHSGPPLEETEHELIPHVVAAEAFSFAGRVQGVIVGLEEPDDRAGRRSNGRCRVGMLHRLSHLVVVCFLLAATTSCADFGLLLLLPEPPYSYPKICITSPVAERKFTTTEATTQICGEFETRKPKSFTVEIVVRNKTNGFITVSSAVNTDEDSRTAEWCTSDDIPLKTGKNKIVVRGDPRRAFDVLVIVREGAQRD
jgi:hypothetical protein